MMIPRCNAGAPVAPRCQWWVAGLPQPLNGWLPKRGGPLCLSAEPGARVEVRDHGIGISEENQKRIFQQFERVSAKTVVAGLGLGLFISEQIVAAHGGSIVVESQINEGALFRVCLPIQENGTSDATSE